MSKLVIFILFLLNVAFAKDTSVKGEGNFWAESGDSLSFIKQQLQHQGFKDVISKELTNMGFNSDEFWEKYEEKFKEDKLTAIKEALDKKFGIWMDPEAENAQELEPKKLNKDQQKDYDSKLRLQTLLAKRNFGNINRVIRSFSVKKISRSPQNPESRYISLEAKVDRVYLSKIYYEFMREQKTAMVSKLYLYTDFNLENTSWFDLGVKVKSDFSTAVDDSWKKWLEDNKIEGIQTIQILDSSDKKDMAKHFNMPYEKLTQEVQDKFKDALVLRVNLNIEKTAHQELFKEYAFDFKGDLVLLDLSTNKVLYKDSLEKQNKVYRDIPYEDLRNAVANFVYRIPLGKFTNMKKYVAKVSKVDSVQTVKIENFQNIDEVFSFIDLLKNKGIKLRIIPVLRAFSSNSAEVVVFYQGGNTTLEKFITGLKNFTGSQEFDFEFFPEQNYRVKLLRKKIKRAKANEEVTLRRRFMNEQMKR